MSRSHCFQVFVGFESEATAAIVGFVDALFADAPLETATVIQLVRVIVETTAAAAVVAAISVIIVIEVVALRGPAVPVDESVAAAVSSGTGFAATESVDVGSV